jgi:hypothetical protein
MLVERSAALRDAEHALEDETTTTGRTA